MAEKIVGNPPVGGTSYDLTTGVVVNMDELIYMYSPVDSPLITGVDADGLALVGSAPVDVRRFDWMDEEILTPRVPVTADVAAIDTSVTIASGDEVHFQVGDFVTWSSPDAESLNEVALVTAVADGVLTVTRNADGNPAGAGTATAANGDEVVGVGMALPEGSDPGPARYRDRVERQNVTQIYGPTQVAMSRTERLVRKYGVPDEWSHQLQNRIKESLIAREQSFLEGRKFDDTTNKRRSTGGLKYWITTNVDQASTSLTVAAIEAAQQLAYQQGGVPDVLMANPAALSDLNDVDNTNRVRVDFADTRRGREPVMTIHTEYGPMIVSRNRWMKTNDAIGFTREGVRRRVMSPLLYEPLAKTGDSDKGQIVCEEGLQVKGERHMFRMDALNY